MLNLLSSEQVYLSDTLEPIFKWVTIGVVLGIIICLIAGYFASKQNFAKLCKNTLIGFVFYALVLGITMLVLEIMKKYDVAYLEDNWVSLDVISHVFLPVLVTLCLALISGITLFVLAKKGFKKMKVAYIVSGALLAVSLIVTLVLIGVHYGNNIVGDGYYSKYLNNIALYICSGAIIILTVVVAFILGKKDKKPFDTRCLAMAGICVALSFCLSYIKLWDMPTGGSVTLVSLLPVMLFSYIYGTKKGLLVGFLYGTLQAIQDPWLIHPAQFLLDYPIAFSMVCFAGVLKDLNVLNKLPQLKFGLSAFIAGSMRFICHVLSGVFAFGAYAFDAGATNFLTYSLVYNLYVFIDVALIIIAGIFLFSSKTMVKQVEQINPSQPNEQ